MPQAEGAVAVLRDVAISYDLAVSIARRGVCGWVGALWQSHGLKGKS